MGLVRLGLCDWIKVARQAALAEGGFELGSSKSQSDPWTTTPHIAYGMFRKEDVEFSGVFLIHIYQLIQMNYQFLCWLTCLSQIQKDMVLLWGGGQREYGFNFWRLESTPCKAFSVSPPPAQTSIQIP